MSEDALHRFRRSERVSLATKLLCQEKGRMKQAFHVDRHHPKGPEIHWVYSNGIIAITNALTKRLITVLIARPGQVARYFKAIDAPVPQDVIEKCREHFELGYNEV